MDRTQDCGFCNRGSNPLEGTMLNLSTPIQDLLGIGSVLQRRLKKLGIKTVNDLVFHFPNRYEDFSNMVSISQIKLGQTCTIKGEIIETEVSRAWKKRMTITTAIIQDDSGSIKATWFNQPYLTKILNEGDNVFLSGKISLNKNEIYLSNPSYEKADADKTLTHTAGLVAVYPETQGLSSRWLRSIIKRVLSQLNNRVPETLPQEIIKENSFPEINKALWNIHFPNFIADAQTAKKRFSFEELFYIELFVLRERLKLSKEKSVSVPVKIDIVKRFVEALPFKLTDDQRKSAWQVLKDMEKPKPMNRLLQGDVGSGKTVVAAIAALNVAKAGQQAVFMAPTEILAKQHFKTVFDVLKDFKISVGLMTGKDDKIYSHKLTNDTIDVSRAKLLKMIKGDINPYTKKFETRLNVLIGTHALIQDTVKFGKLALVVVDEQHRFGVEQRAKLCMQDHQRIIPHLLSMTATPIPRTLALTVFGDLDLSLITQMPKGRKKVITEIIEPKDREKTYRFIRKEVKKGRQVFVICPRIENKKKGTDSNVIIDVIPEQDFTGWSEVRAVQEEYEKLSKDTFPDLKVAMLHGKMKSKEKEKIMKDFRTKKSDILVSTSVVEVGIDVPNATVMMIEGAERFGLAQLHQFRGRVGRSKYQSYCFLLTTFPDQSTRKRLKAMVQFNSGFELAEKDLEIRGPGDLSGTRQWGMPDIVMDSLKDLKLIEKTREIAKDLLQKDPELKKCPALREKLNVFREKIHLE